MRIVYRAENIIDANLVKGALAAEGIPAFVNGEHLTGGIGQLPAFGLVSVMVADCDVERAAPVLAAIAPAQAADRDEAIAGLPAAP